MIRTQPCSASLPFWGASLLVLAFWSASLLPALGQDSSSACQTKLESASEAYLNQEYETAVRLASECADQSIASDEEAIRAYRLMSLAYFRRDALQEARSAVTQILSIDSTYTADPVEDPPSYSLLVSMVRDLLAENPTFTRREREPTFEESFNGFRTPAPLESVASTGLSYFDPLVPPNELTAPGVSFEHGPPGRSLLSTNGLRLTIRNKGYELVNGLNLTLWRPHPSRYEGRINGLALGIPTTGTAHLRGVGIGLLGVTGRETVHGLGIGGIGVTAGELHGLSIGGIGLRIDDHLYGVSVNGGLTGGRGSLRGIAASGIGLAVGGSAGGLQVGGLGVRTKEGIGGITLGTIGASSAGDVSGLTLTGGFIHAGRRLRGIQATGGPIVASHVQGLAVSSLVVHQSGTGVIVAPVYAHAGREGSLTGLSVSAVNHVRGRQQGLTIGLFNYAKDLGGVQLGLLNYAGNNPLFLRLLPGLNLNF